MMACHYPWPAPRAHGCPVKGHASLAVPLQDVAMPAQPSCAHSVVNLTLQSRARRCRPQANERRSLQAQEVAARGRNTGRFATGAPPAPDIPPAPPFTWRDNAPVLTYGKLGVCPVVLSPHSRPDWPYRRTENARQSSDAASSDPAQTAPSHTATTARCGES